MTKTELKQNITKINKLLRSDSYEAGIELIKTLDDPEIKKGTLKEVLKHPDYYEAGIKSVKTLDVSVIDEGIIKLLLKQRDYDAIDTGIELARGLDEPSVFETLLEGCSIDEEGKLISSKMFTGTGKSGKETTIESELIPEKGFDLVKKIKDIFGWDGKSMK